MVEQALSGPVNLRCEYLVDPLGIDVMKPRLSWEMKIEQRGARQAAYEIQVGKWGAGAAAAAAFGKADSIVWSSGRVESGRSNQVEYAGSALQPAMFYAWRVRVWDGTGQESAWSEPATWSMGLKSENWKAKWIGVPDARTPAVTGLNGYHSQLVDSPDTAKWVSIDLGQLAKVESVVLCPARPHDWKVDAPGSLFPVRYAIESSTDGEKWTAIADRTTKDQANPGTEVVSLAVTPTEARYVRLRAVKLAARTPPDKDQYGLALAEMEVLSGGRNIAAGKTATASDSTEHNDWSVKNLTDGVRESRKAAWPKRGPGASLTTKFSAGDKIARATLYATAMGLYEANINGQRVGDALLAPEWTDYKKRVQVQAYDVTKLVKSGENRIGATVADGWFAGKIGLFANEMYGQQLALLAQLEIEYADGRKQLVVTDTSWSGTNDGPWRAADILDGVSYDARKELVGVQRMSGDGSVDSAAWSPAIETPVKGVELVAQMNEPIRIVGEIKPVSVTEPKPGVWVFDTGQNMTGWARLGTTGPAGTVITMRYAEAVNPDGTVYTTNLRGAKQTDTFILRGSGGREMLEPAFTYHGFRYVEVTGLVNKPTRGDLMARVSHSALPVAGEFACSDEMLNKLMSNIVWTQVMNMFSTPTDCPQRDERLGWMGDAQVFAQAACYNRDMASFFTKWLRDVRDAQHPDGRYPDFAPNPLAMTGKFTGVPAWGDAGVIVPWRVYENYGDDRLIAEQLESAKRWVDYIAGQNPDFVWRKGRGNDYNDWLNADTLRGIPGWPEKGGEIPKEVFATAFFEQSARMVAKMAAVAGKSEDAKKYGGLADRVREEFRKQFIAADGRMPGDTQAGYALALQNGLCPDDLRPKMVQYLVEGIHRYNDHVSTGFISTMPMMRQLHENGQTELAYKLLMNRTIPSWGYMIDQGATSVWERWDGYVEGRGFQDPGMNSLAHYSIGSVGEWMYRVILGLNPDEQTMSSDGKLAGATAWKHFTVAPVPGGGLTWAKGSYRSMYGKIAVDWKKEGGKFTLNVVVPANSTATVRVPVKDEAAAKGVMEGGKPAVQSEGVKAAGWKKGSAEFEVGAGSYSFTVME